jgi:2-polyprenyl-3-methyl-5-hydroxy-6-metoxy-1,4-benzoquinol methylase
MKRKADYRSLIYKNYKAEQINNFPDPKLLEKAFFQKFLIKKYFPIEKSSKILDLGCGFGLLVLCCHKYGYKNTLGVDNSESQIVLSKKNKIKNVIKIDAIIFLDKAKANFYDCIVLTDFIEHLKKDELLHLLKKCFKALRPKGRIIINTPNGSSPLFGSYRYGDFTHEICLNEDSIKQVLSFCGFKLISCNENKPIVHGFKSLLRYILWGLLRYIWVLMTFIETGEFSHRRIYSRNFTTIAFK